MGKLLLSVLLLISLSFTLFPSHLITQAKENTNNDYIPFQILSINDFHGNLDTKSTLNGKEVGGAAYLATHLNQRQAEMEAQAEKDGKKPVTLRLEAGDAVGASPTVSSLLQDEPTMKALNQMDFKLGVLGNHSFDEGIQEFKRLLHATSVHPNVAKYTEGTDYKYRGVDDDFKFLAANVVEKASGEHIFDPYTIKQVGGVHVGFIGIVTPETTTSAAPKHTKSYQFLDITKTINKYAMELEKKGVKAIVVVAHEGASTNNGETTGVMADLASKLDDQVDIIFAAHSHEIANGVVDGKLINQNYNYGQAFGDVRTKLDPETDDFVKGSTKAEVVLNTRDVTPDPEVQAIVSEAKKVTEKAASEPIGQAASGESIGKRKPEDGENELGNPVTDAQRIMTTGADFAITNSGGIREALIPQTNDKGNHIITWGAAYAVQPFNGYMQLIELTGQQIKDGLSQQWQKPGEIMFLQISGFKYTYIDGSKVPDCKQKYCVQDVFLADGKTKMDMNKTYKVAMNEFLADGGDGFSVFSQGEVLRNAQTDTETFIAYIEKLASEGKKVDPKIEGRATLVEPSKKDVDDGSSGTAIDKSHGKADDDNSKTDNLGDNTNDSNSGHKLPETSTNIYKNLLVGIILIGAGFTILLYRRKRI
ncbi:5'-nucleotidase C-terminal domain-containing protein [Halobacillus shinanisalinarum]|uniref:5'-nucleotidase C-terminal domain-containing protein n=1 Tax=Halobacillus shinanisalinarum TaxID=2932258 RepID=A0ABY4H3P3_9BACI|nr:5'-nucleotidase C-terminal domain-containing protein [Halobacillus shinanisalinarum]UOQ94740.1 5'-nucleotidase C-terminal domain-containing protein [Halobacillus shinanisalinarum]